MRITEVKCPDCGYPIFSRDTDLIVLCDRCGALHNREHPAYVVSYEMGELEWPGTDGKAYLPFWCLDVAFHITKVENKYDRLTLYGLLVSGVEKEGRIKMFVPAFTLDPLLFREMAVHLTNHPPAVRPEKLDPKVRRLPCIVKSGTAEKMANFLFITDVADKPGVLQDLDYRLTVISDRLVYLSCCASPAVKSDYY